MRDGLTPIKKRRRFSNKIFKTCMEKMVIFGNSDLWQKILQKCYQKFYRETVVADIFQDQISSANPLAALVAAPILDQLDILQAKPYLSLYAR